ncbi:MAG: hypothetical protein HZB80_10165 [Deltaproteobacteria bacterium]|nr:hypothetical protein [Deltaproteobacteria bacterium]
MPSCCKQGKTCLTIAIGCIGGKHRSVAIVDFLADKISWERCVLKKRHRDRETVKAIVNCKMQIGQCKKKRCFLFQFAVCNLHSSMKRSDL